MDATYELWDVDAGNIVGAFASEDEGLDVAAALLATYGRDYANHLNLSHRDGAGGARVVAIGSRLIEMTERRAQERKQRAGAPLP